MVPISRKIVTYSWFISRGTYHIETTKPKTESNYDQLYIKSSENKISKRLKGGKNKNKNKNEPSCN
jgi:hypothetical protein